MRIISTCLVLLVFAGVSYGQDLKSDENVGGWDVVGYVDKINEMGEQTERL